MANIQQVVPFSTPLILLLLLHIGDGAIVSMGEPDWSISKADLVDELYSYDPSPRSLFPIFRTPAPPIPVPQASNLRPHTLPPPSPKYTKFSIQDKKDFNYLPPKKVISPVYTTTSAPPPQVQYPEATSVDSQTILWPQETDQKLSTNTEETALRFVVHKTGDETEIRKALEEDGAARGQDVKFIEGPTLRIQRHQKVYLPPKKKTVVYILLKEPQILTDVEVVGGTEEPVPEVFITYQKSDGNVRTKHYSPDTVKGDKYLNQLRSSLTDPSSTTTPRVNKRSACAPNVSA